MGARMSNNFRRMQHIGRVVGRKVWARGLHSALRALPHVVSPGWQRFAADADTRTSLAQSCTCCRGPCGSPNRSLALPPETSPPSRGIMSNRGGTLVRVAPLPSMLPLHPSLYTLLWTKKLLCTTCAKSYTTLSTRPAGLGASPLTVTFTIWRNKSSNREGHQPQL